MGLLWRWFSYLLVVYNLYSTDYDINLFHWKFNIAIFVRTCATMSTFCVHTVDAEWIFCSILLARTPSKRSGPKWLSCGGPQLWNYATCVCVSSFSKVHICCKSDTLCRKNVLNYLPLTPGECERFACFVCVQKSCCFMSYR